MARKVEQLSHFVRNAFRSRSHELLPSSASGSWLIAAGKAGCTSGVGEDEEEEGGCRTDVAYITASQSAHLFADPNPAATHPSVLLLLRAGGPARSA